MEGQGSSSAWPNSDALSLLNALASSGFSERDTRKQETNPSTQTGDPRVIHWSLSELEMKEIVGSS